jgi:uncharacterized protein YegL
MSEEIKNALLPVYLVLDTSASMADKFDAAMNFLPALYDELVQSASLADKLRVEVITFDEKTAVCVPLSDMEQLVKYMKKLKAEPIVPDGGSTYYGEAFSRLREQIELDVQQLERDGYEVHRPVAFLITDGEPNDDASARDASYSKLTADSFNHRPNLICVGVGKATKESLKKYGASSYKYNWKYTTGNEHVVLVPRDGVTPAKAVNDIIPVLIHSIPDGTAPSQKNGEVSDPFGEQEVLFDELGEDWED